MFIYLLNTHVYYLVCTTAVLSGEKSLSSESFHFDVSSVEINFWASNGAAPAQGAMSANRNSHDFGVPVTASPDGSPQTLS